MHIDLKVSNITTNYWALPSAQAGPSIFVKYWLQWQSELATEGLKPVDISQSDEFFYEFEFAITLHTFA